MVVDAKQTVVGNGDSMGVTGQVLQNVFRTAERRLGVNHPLLTGDGFEKRCETSIEESTYIVDFKQPMLWSPGRVAPKVAPTKKITAGLPFHVHTCLFISARISPRRHNRGRGDVESVLHFPQLRSPCASEFGRGTVCEGSVQAFAAEGFCCNTFFYHCHPVQRNAQKRP